MDIIQLVTINRKTKAPDRKAGLDNFEVTNNVVIFQFSEKIDNIQILLYFPSPPFLFAFL